VEGGGREEEKRKDREEEEEEEGTRREEKRKDGEEEEAERGVEGRATLISYSKSSTDDGMVANVCHSDLILGIITIEGVSYLVLVVQKSQVGELEGKPIYCIRGARFLSFKSDRYVSPSFLPLLPPASSYFLPSSPLPLPSYPLSSTLHSLLFSPSSSPYP
jgi:hypothetical protein